MAGIGRELKRHWRAFLATTVERASVNRSAPLCHSAQFRISYSGLPRSSTVETAYCLCTFSSLVKRRPQQGRCARFGQAAIHCQKKGRIHTKEDPKTRHSNCTRLQARCRLRWFLSPRLIRTAVSPRILTTLFWSTRCYVGTLWLAETIASSKKQTPSPIFLKRLNQGLVIYAFTLSDFEIGKTARLRFWGIPSPDAIESHPGLKLPW